MRVEFDSRKNLAGSLLFLLLYFDSVFLITIIAVFGSNLGASETLFFGIPAVLFGMVLFFIFGMIGVLYIFIDKFALKGVDISIIFDPEKGLLSRYIPFLANPLIVFFLLVIVFSPLLFVSNVVQKSALIASPEYSFLDVPARIFYAGEPTVFGETMIQVILFGLSYGFAFWLSRGNTAILYGVLFFMTLLDGLFMAGYHLLRYAGQEPKLVSVFAFFWITFFLAFLLGNILVFIVPHNINNWLWGAKGILSNDLILAIAIGVYILVIASFIAYLTLYYFPRRKGRHYG